MEAGGPWFRERDTVGSLPTDVARQIARVRTPLHQPGRIGTKFFAVVTFTITVCPLRRPNSGPLIT